MPSILSVLLRLWSREIRTLADHTGLRPVASWDCGFESHRGHRYVSLESSECFQVEDSATGQHPSGRVLPNFVSKCDSEASPIRRTGPTRGCRAMGGGGIRNRKLSSFLDFAHCLIFI